MYEVFKIKSSKPIPKILQKPLRFWKTLKVSKIPKTQVKNHEMHEYVGFRHLPSEENLIKVEESLRKCFKVKERGFGWWKG